MNKLISKERVLAMTVMLLILLVVYFVFLYNVSIIEGEKYYSASSEMTTKQEAVAGTLEEIVGKFKLK